ncbi:hypothetical protein CLV84_3292 [Neolewinella xylanilytica]|uniref:Uncharacterized protein n=1 Tax=Neolewinella xylanilytica TaxID=1514080 RepID=A0A2S6I5B6_9BACT|nr:hypothetical protein [Neolewinella xylanilytica]PPK86366.1 hypothetical protein CLV84_3292 [Neolewinella xylanilytica]
MKTSTHRFTLATRYGDATFTITFDENGRISIIGTPLEGLPDSVYQLTYGHDWPTVKAYFEDLCKLLPFWAEAYLTTANAPAPLLPLSAFFATEFTPESVTGAPGYWAEQGHWRELFHPDPVLRNRMLSRATGEDHTLFRNQAAAYLEPYLLALVAAPTLGSVAEAYRLLGTLGTPSARQFLLAELEREGRHPYTRHLLFGLRYFQNAADLVRIAAVYRSGNISEDDLPAVLKYMDGVPGKTTLDFARELLADHAYLSESILRVFYGIRLQDKDIRPLLLRAFEAEKAYHHLDILLRTTNRLSTEPINLEAMNRRAAAPEFLDVPPVNWPQQLEPGWTTLVRTTPPGEALRIIAAYLDRPEPRLQRNALLQMKVLVQQPEFSGTLPGPVEHRLRDLLRSPFDKVYVEVLNLLGMRSLTCADPLPMLDAILRLSVGTRYRIVVLKALRGVGDFPAARERARTFLSDAITKAPDTRRLEHLTALLPYVEKYLGQADDLRSQLNARVSVLTD